MQNNNSVYDLSGLSDEQIVLCAQSQDKRATEYIIMRYKNIVYKIASKFFMQGFDRDDIVQEGMIGLYNAILDFKDGKTSFKSFCTLCISRRIISLLKSSERRKNIPLNTALSLDSSINDDSGMQFIQMLEDNKTKNPEAIIIGRENLLHYEKETKKLLSPFELEVWSYHMSGMSYKDIAVTLSKNTKSIDNAIQRIRKKLSQMIEADS